LANERIFEYASFPNRLAQCVWKKYVRNMLIISKGEKALNSDRGSMKVVHIVNHFSEEGGGIERVIRDMYERIASRSNIDFVIFSYGKKNETKIIDNMCLRRLKGFRVSYMSVLPSLLRELIKEKPDVIHVHVPYPYGLVNGVITKVVLAKPLVVSYHTDPPLNLAISKMYKRIEPVLLRRADVVLATSNTYKRNSEILRKLKNVEVLRLGINIHRFVPKQCPDENIILTVGRKTFYKNTEMLIQAMENVRKEFPNAKLLIAGKDYERKEGKNIKFLGYLSDEELLSLYQRCTFFVLPSTTNDEGFGLVLLESMACGKPVIAFDLWGPSEVIGDCGIIVKEKNVEALADGMIKLLKDEELRQDLARKARERVLRYFSIEAYDKMVDIYRDLASSTRFE